MIQQLIWIVPTAPLLAVLWIAVMMISGRHRGDAGEKPTAVVSIASLCVSLLVLVGIDFASLSATSPEVITVGEWFHSGNFVIHFNFILDKLSLGIATLMLLLLLIVVHFSVNYLHREQGYQRFFMILCLFSSAVLFVVLSGNAVLTFVGWEMAGISSYLLIGFNSERNHAIKNANYALITNRIGDAGFLFSLYLVYHYTGSSDWISVASLSLSEGTLKTGMIVAGFSTAALVKSAAIPFSTWISKALEGPTPSSAIFYGALLTHLGVYLVLRLETLITQVPMILWSMVLLGSLTALYGWLSGLVQSDVKSSLIFSTTAQIGLMFVECGLGWFTLASWHLALHMIWRTWQFLSSPSLMHMVNRPARAAPLWLRINPRLHTSALQRFWLEPLAEWTILRPIKALARETRDFDSKVVNRITGTSAGANESTLYRHQSWIDNIGRARGFSGHAMEIIASAFQWFEEHLILKGGGDGLLKVVNILGQYMLVIEKLLSQPRYLIAIILITFVIIL